MKTIFPALIVFLFTVSLHAQENLFYIPRDIQKAYNNGTRSWDGMPGENYWQNRSVYKIQAEVLPDKSILKGTEKITYYNNSPDTLYRIMLRLYQNIYQKGNARDFSIGSASLTDGEDILFLSLNGDTLITEGSMQDVIFTATNMIITCPNGINPDTSVELELKWEFIIPTAVPIRMGNYGDGDMFIAYWYPQVAVYDDINGWDRVEYYGSAEFYNDFNDYHFEITVPDNFAVWATGELQNTEEVFSDDIIDKINAAKNSVDVITVFDFTDYVDGINKSTAGKNVWKFEADNVADVSFCISDNFRWDAASVEVEPGRRILANAVYQDGTKYWEEAAMYARESVKYLSTELPGYPYPYSYVTSFCNKRSSGGMETPMMQNNGIGAHYGYFVRVIFHEIAHSYLPFFMGTNERKYGFMDEGWASFFPYEFVKKYAPEFDEYGERVRDYLYSAGDESEMPPMTLTYSYKTPHFRTGSYNRPTVAYRELYRLLGHDRFKNAFLEYMDRWHEKHPIPYDFFNTFNDALGENLNWFFKPWVADYGYPDLAIESADQNDDNVIVKIKKIGNIPTQIKLTFFNEDSEEIKTVFESAYTWKDKNVAAFSYVFEEPVTEIILGDKYIPDVDNSNNTYVLSRE